jgi:glutamate/tyrosine decarboxylase-like PLP-dependent enzyme
MTASMHEWDESTDLFAHAVIGYAIERLKVPKDPQWGAHKATDLAATLDTSITPTGIGGHAALAMFRDVLMPACRPMDDPLNLAYVPTAPSIAATMFDLVVSASSIFGGNWEAGTGAIAAENTALRWLADLAGFPAEAGGVFVSGGSAANLSALATARHRAQQRRTELGLGRPARWCIVTTDEVHASVRAAARIMDVDVLEAPTDDLGRFTGAALAAVLAEHSGVDRVSTSGRAADVTRHATGAAGDSDTAVFAVVATGGTTNAGAVDELDALADVCADHDLWLHIDGAYGLAALCSDLVGDTFRGIERADSFGVDPHKWLFAPYDCAALVYREPAHAAAAHAQHGAYLDAVNRNDWNPSDYAYHLSRRARGLPLWFSLATYGTAAYTEAVDVSIATARTLAADIAARPGFDLLLEPQLSIVLFTLDGWTRDDYLAWSTQRAREGVALLVPTTWKGQPCMRICLVNPRTRLEDVQSLLDDLAGFPLRR